MIPSPSPLVNIQIIGWKVYLRISGKTLLGDVNKLIASKGLLTMPRNVLLLHLKQTFPTIIWIFTEGEKMMGLNPGNISKYFLLYQYMFFVQNQITRPILVQMHLYSVYILRAYFFSKMAITWNTGSLMCSNRINLLTENLFWAKSRDLAVGLHSDTFCPVFVHFFSSGFFSQFMSLKI